MVQQRAFRSVGVTAGLLLVASWHQPELHDSNIVFPIPLLGLPASSLELVRIIPTAWEYFFHKGKYCGLEVEGYLGRNMNL